MLSKLVPNLKVSKNVFSKPHLSFSASTELANMLVRKYKVPFRTAHKIVGSLIRILTEYKLALDDVTPELLQKVAQDSSSISLNINIEDIREATDPLKIVKSYNARGGPSPTEVKRMLKIRKQWTVLARSNLSEKKRKLNEAEDRLQSVVQSYSSPDNASIIKLKSSSG